MFAIIVKEFVDRRMVIDNCCPGRARYTESINSTALRGGSYYAPHSFGGTTGRTPSQGALRLLVALALLSWIVMKISR